MSSSSVLLFSLSPSVVSPVFAPFLHEQPSGRIAVLRRWSCFPGPRSPAGSPFMNRFDLYSRAYKYLSMQLNGRRKGALQKEKRERNDTSVERLRMEISRRLLAVETRIISTPKPRARAHFEDNSDRREEKPKTRVKHEAERRGRRAASFPLFFFPLRSSPLAIINARPGQGSERGCREGQREKNGG